MQESTLLCAPLPTSGAPDDIGSLLRASAAGQDWVALDNANQRLHDDTADGFVAWAAELLEAPVVTWEISGSLAGFWGANPNLATRWYSGGVTLGGVSLGRRSVAVEDASLAWALARSPFDSAPRQRVSMLYAWRLTGSDGRPLPFPPPIPIEGVSNPLVFDQGGTTPNEPSYGWAVGELMGPAVQYAFLGQWVQRFFDQSPSGVVQGKTSSTVDTWTDVGAPLDGLGAMHVIGLRVWNQGNGDMEVRFGPGSLPTLEIASGSDEGWGDTDGAIGIGKGLAITPNNRLQIRSTAVDDAFRVQYFVPQGGGGCSCGG